MGPFFTPTADVYVRTDTLSRKRVRYGSLYTRRGDIIRLKKQAINHRVNATQSTMYALSLRASPRKRSDNART